MATAIAKDWWKNAVCYQIYPRSFCDSNGDGIGDIPGIISKLSYLKNLGVDVIWLSPVYPSPNCDNGYDISDYKAIHPDFGTMEDMERLISKAKRLGIKIIMDLVINHTSDEHPWFQAALAGDEKYKDYYYFRNKPNNWGSFFGGKAWTKTESGEYYLHLFSPKQPDLNWNNPSVYNEVVDIMRFWLDKGIAGFRCDVINIIYKNSLENGRFRIVLPGLEHYLTTDGCHEILKKFRDEVWAEYKPFIVGETVMVDTEMAKALSDEDRQELDQVFFFEHMDVDDRGVKYFRKKYKPEKFIKILDKWQNAMDWPANYLENHDQNRSVNHFGDAEHYWRESAKLLCGLNMSLRGTPYIYEGQELGMTNGDFKSMSDLRDFEAFNMDKAMKKIGIVSGARHRMIIENTRDNARTPMQWDSSENAGFTTGTPWIQVNKNKMYVNAEDEDNDENSVLSFYRRMIELRKNSPALTKGFYRKLASQKDVYIFTRESEEERLYVYCNMTGMKRHVEIYGDYKIFDSYREDQLEEFVLQPYEFRIMKSNI